MMGHPDIWNPTAEPFEAQDRQWGAQPYFYFSSNIRFVNELTVVVIL